MPVGIHTYEKHVKRTRRKKEQGSVAVLTAMLLPIMLLMIMLLANIGQAVFEKIRLQNTVDACALSAATVQSVGLNEIADLNFEALREYVNLTQILTTAPLWDSMADGMSCINYFKKVLQSIHLFQDRANIDYAQDALRIAQLVKNKNLPQATLTSINPEDTRLAKFSSPESMSVGFLYRICNCCPCPGPGCACSCCPTQMVAKWNDALAGDSRYYSPKQHDGRFYIVNFVGLILPYLDSVGVRVRKETQPTTYSAFKITQRSKNFILASGIFGRLEELKAYAAAKPTGGHVYDMQPTYKPIMTRLSTLNPKPQTDEKLSLFEH